MSYFTNRSQALAVLGVNEGYSLTQLKAAYFKKAKQSHPDTGGTHEEFLKLQQAYEYLSKETKPITIIEEEDELEKHWEYTQQHYDSNYIKPNLPNLMKNLSKRALELYIIYFSNSNYLFKAATSQFILFGLWFNNILNITLPKLTLAGALQISLLTLYLLIVTTLLILLTALFHRKIWFLSLKLEKFSYKKLNKIRNISVLLFTFTTLPGYIIYLTISISLRFIKLLISMIR
jgi:hypothetical protein